MPYTPDATDVANPVEGTVKAITAAAEFRTIKLYLRDVLLAGVNLRAPIASPQFTGNVGIGVAATALLHVRGTVANKSFLLESTVAGSTGSFELTPGNTAFGAPVLDMVNSVAGATSRSFISSRNNLLSFLGQTSHSFSFGVNGGAEFFRIKSSGGVVFQPTSAPASPQEGEVYYDSASKKHYGWNGTLWNAFY